MNTDLYQAGQRLPIMEEFYTLQGEGYQTGKPAYFIRIGGCDIGCNWCDSKRSWSFEEHPLVDIDELVERVLLFPAKAVVVTGGEPGLYPLDYLCDRLHQSGVMTYIETSGAYFLTGTWDWICLSPKLQSPPERDNCKIASELKVIIESSADFEWAEKNAALVTPGCHLFLQPEWSRRSIMMDEIISYIGNHPKWRLSLQSHKYIGIP